MESKLKDELKNEIIENVIKYTNLESKITYQKKFNEDLIDDSLKNIPKQYFNLKWLYTQNYPKPI